uniref:WW domain binding protein VOPP1 n=1 Tax=Oncorhynchus mykiss TaxID=8022 RepID=A0A8C7QVJ3_ONCMY
MSILLGLLVFVSDIYLSTVCRSYEDCCGTRCCVRALSIQRLWYFWLLLMMGVLFCCGAGFFIRRRMNPSPLPEDTFNVTLPTPSPSRLLQPPSSTLRTGAADLGKEVTRRKKTLELIK